MDRGDAGLNTRRRPEVHSFFLIDLDVGRGPQLSLDYLSIHSPSGSSRDVWLDATIRVVRDGRQHATSVECTDVENFHDRIERFVGIGRIAVERKLMNEATCRGSSDPEVLSRASAADRTFHCQQSPDDVQLQLQNIVYNWAIADAA